MPLERAMNEISRILPIHLPLSLSLSLTFPYTLKRYREKSVDEIKHKISK